MVHRHTNPDVSLAPKATLRQAMVAMTRSKLGLVVVVDARRKVLGVLADIDLRRALLDGADMSTPVSKAMNARPVLASSTADEETIAELFRSTGKTHLPVVDAKGTLVEIASLMDFVTIPHRFPNWVVVMAGGLGTRLRPLTNNVPKPMLRVGGKPILELLLEQFTASGFGHFIFSVNYLADQIRAHFGNGERWGVTIEYVDEEQPLGTAGALGLIKRQFSEPVIVTNGDILTKVDFAQLLEFHRKERNVATMCVREFETQVPYGVVELRDKKLASIVEKPVHRFLVNAGVYVLDPAAARPARSSKPQQMPDYFERLRRRHSGRVGCFPISEYWLDIGKAEDYARAMQDYEKGLAR